MRGWRWSRCIPTRSRRCGRDSASRAASQTALTASCWPSWLAPTATASGCWCPTATRPRRCAAMTRARDSLVRTRVGLANQLRDQLALLLARRQPTCSGRSTRRSRWRSCAAIPRRSMPAAWASSGCGVPQAPRLHRPQTRARAARAAAQRSAKAEPASSRCKPAARSCWHSSPRLSRSSRGSAS